MSDIVIYDLEYTSWEGAQARNWSGENEHREIVQIAAAKIDRETLDVIGSPFNCLVTPVFNPILSEYFINLTGITQDIIDEKGVLFQTALSRFKEYCGDSPLFSYGSDHIVINENIDLYDMAETQYVQGTNIKPWFQAVSEDEKLPNSGALSGHFGLSLPAGHRKHNALSDVHSIIIAARHFIFDKNAPSFAPHD